MPNQNNNPSNSTQTSFNFVPTTNTAATNGGTFTISAQPTTGSIYFVTSGSGWNLIGETPIEEEKDEAHPKAKKIELPDGSEAMECIGCDKQTPYAEPNQDNGTFKCYECRELRS